MGKQSTERRQARSDGDDADTAAEPGQREYDAGDPAHVGERRTTAQQRERDIAAGLGETLATKQGRALVHWLLTECGIYSTSFTGNSTTFFNEGKRQIGLQVLARVTKDHPDAYLTMLKEGAR